MGAAIKTPTTRARQESFPSASKLRPSLTHQLCGPGTDYACPSVTDPVPRDCPGPVTYDGRYVPAERG